MSLIWRYLCCLALWLSVMDGAVGANVSAYDADNAESWYQVEVVVFLNDFKAIVPEMAGNVVGNGNNNGNTEALWHKKTRPLPTMTHTLIPVKGIERRPRTLGELNSLMYSSEYAPDIRIIPVGSTVELEDVVLLLQTIKPLYSSTNSLTAIAEPDSLGQYWPYIKPLEISGSTLDKAVFDSLDFQNETSGHILEDENEPVILVSADEAFRRLPDSELQLLKAAQRIKRSANYRLLTHQSWYQPIPPRGNGWPVLLGIAGKDSNGGVANSFLTGTVTVESGRFLHARIDLQYILPIAVGESGYPDALEPQTVYMELDARVRMRNNEVHYLDHPHLSAFIMLTDYEPEYPEGPQQP